MLCFEIGDLLGSEVGRRVMNCRPLPLSSRTCGHMSMLIALFSGAQQMELSISKHVCFASLTASATVKMVLCCAAHSCCTTGIRQLLGMSPFSRLPVVLGRLLRDHFHIRC